MTNEPKAEDQRVLDARMEYGLLMNTYLTLANMFWIGNASFFAVNTLLGTGLGLSYSDAAGSVNKTLIGLAHVLIPITGMVFALIGIYAAVEVTRFQRITTAQGIELEKVLFARSFERLRHSNRFPWASLVGSLLFFSIWAGALYAALRP